MSDAGAIIMAAVVILLALVLGYAWWYGTQHKAVVPQPVWANGPAPYVSPYLLTLGDIGVTENEVVTPNGTAPLKGSQWIVRDMTQTRTRVPVWAIVMAIVLFLACFLGLLLLMVKEEYIVGWVEVSVRSGGVYHVAQLAVRNRYDIQRIRSLVAQAQSQAVRNG